MLILILLVNNSHSKDLISSNVKVDIPVDRILNCHLSTHREYYINTTNHYAIDT